VRVGAEGGERTLHRDAPLFGAERVVPPERLGHVGEGSTDALHEPLESPHHDGVTAAARKLSLERPPEPCAQVGHGRHGSSVAAPPSRRRRPSTGVRQRPRRGVMTR
jgi:hypothetical protein